MDSNSFPLVMFNDKQLCNCSIYDVIITIRVIPGIANFILTSMLRDWSFSNFYVLKRRERRKKVASFIFIIQLFISANFIYLFFFLRSSLHIVYFIICIFFWSYLFFWFIYLICLCYICYDVFRKKKMKMHVYMISGTIFISCTNITHVWISTMCARMCVCIYI